MQARRRLELPVGRERHPVGVGRAACWHRRRRRGLACSWRAVHGGLFTTGAHGSGAPRGKTPLRRPAKPFRRACQAFSSSLASLFVEPAKPFRRPCRPAATRMQVAAWPNADLDGHPTSAPTDTKPGRCRRTATPERVLDGVRRRRFSGTIGVAGRADVSRRPAKDRPAGPETQAPGLEAFRDFAPALGGTGYDAGVTPPVTHGDRSAPAKRPDVRWQAVIPGRAARGNPGAAGPERSPPASD